MIADDHGRGVPFSLASGQARELPQEIGLLERLPGVPRWVVGDVALPAMPSKSTSGTWAAAR
ncbi:hypothetical protein [Geminicoccus roseus]|uniref:hypothetical protein n=1 Tax=Geminicoccus roseus TaxID=404900 RepID=UPI0012F73008|nr:hypothetical protein [Geminicoccus roseus]